VLDLTGAHPSRDRHLTRVLFIAAALFAATAGALGAVYLVGRIGFVAGMAVTLGSIALGFPAFLLGMRHARRRMRSS